MYLAIPFIRHFINKNLTFPAYFTCFQTQQRPMLVTWNDFVLSLFIALSIGAVLFALQSLPPVAVVKLQIQWILLYQDFIVNARWLLPALSFGLAAFFAALTIPTLVQMVSNRQ